MLLVVDLALHEKPSCKTFFWSGCTCCACKFIASHVKQAFVPQASTKARAPVHPLLILLCTCFASNNSFVGSKAGAKGGEQLRATCVVRLLVTVTVHPLRAKGHAKQYQQVDAKHGHGHGHVPQHSK